MNVIEFADNNVTSNEKGGPWSLSKHQREVLALMFARHYSIRLWSEVKKSGKTFLAAIIALWESVTNADSEIICAANDEEQAISRVFQTCCQLIKHNGELSGSAKVLATEIRWSNGSIIRAVSSDYKGQAGGRQRLTVFDELWAFDHERMVRLFEEMTPPPTEKGAYLLIVSYAGFSGEGELLENLYKRAMKGRRVHRSLECRVDRGLFCFWSHKRRQAWQVGPEGRAYYQEQARILRENTFRRLHRNEWVSSESVFITPELWDQCVDQSRTPLLSGGSLYLGVDLAVKSDTAALVGVAWERQTGRLILATHRVWRPTKKEPVQLADVEQHILDLKKRHRIARLYADPFQAMQMLQSLTRKLGESVVCEYPQTVANTTVMGEELFNLIKGKNLVAYPDSDIRTHVLNCTGVETARGFRLAKEKASRKIDLCVALSMACCAALEAGKPITNYTAVPVGVGKSAPSFDKARDRAMNQPFPGDVPPEEDGPNKGEHEIFRFHWGWGGG
jgi:phage terminase large subunit-like protein